MNINKAQYNAFGITQIITEKITTEQATTEQVTNNIRFLGQYFDTKTGLNYSWQKYYDPEVGRYVRAGLMILADSKMVSHIDISDLFVFCY